jgi:methylated-DNA-[protein]-cysteine S-methyltransferase
MDNSTITVKNYKSPLGELVLGSFRGSLCLCDWRYRKMMPRIRRRIESTLGAEFSEGESDVIREAEWQLAEYFGGERKNFELPLLTTGTEFQKRVWTELLKIPYGQTISYKELARRTGRAGAVRAAAGANGANALSIIIPCHRVISSGGGLGGYAGGLGVKDKLLRLESGDVQPRLEEIAYTTDKSRMDFDMVVEFLRSHTYWAEGRPAEVILKSIENSLCVGVFLGGRQIGFGRAVTDYATVYYLADIFILPEYQNRGIGHGLMDYIHSLDELKGLRGILTTRTAHSFYGEFGYGRDNPVVKERIMVRV